ncbi:MAG: twin-arginine translocase TatA/TatE family subunit [Chloroflexi bacterium]|nr:twin-arginine translocase TatA/TatE family subunit [Chloroflexota bacterium]
MEILGVGASELIFILIIALIVLGPRDMQKAGKTIGKWLRNIVTSDGWKVFQQTSRELRTLPNKLIRDANDELNQIGNEINNASDTTLRHAQDNAANWPVDTGNGLRSRPIPENQPENRIAPPVIAPKPQEGDSENNA